MCLCNEFANKKIRYSEEEDPKGVNERFLHSNKVTV